MDLILQSEVFTLPFVSFVAGLVFCLLGRRILAFVVILFGFLIGYSWGTAFLVSVLKVSLSQYPWLPWAAGAGGAALGLVAWKVSMFFAGFVIGLFVIRGILPALPGLAHTAIALATGLLVHIYREPIIALLTAMAGAYITAGASVIMLTDVDFFHVLRSYVAVPRAQMVAGIILTIIFSIIGYKFQTRGINT